MAVSNKIIKIAHLIKDDKFFESSANFYDKIEGVDNRYYLFSRRKNKEFKYIKSSEKITVFTNYLTYIKAIRKCNLVRFDSFLSLDYFTLLFTSSHQTVLWKGWGYDIYDKLNGMPPLVRLDLYRPLTNNYIKKNKKVSYLSRFKNILLGTVLSIIRRIGMSKIDYMVPCIPMDYELVKEQCPFFHAKQFPVGQNPIDAQFNYKEKRGNVLVGNSLTYTNNHLDVFERLYDIRLSDDIKFIVPINYGSAYNKGEDLIKLSRFKEGQVIWLRSFMDRTSYFSLINSVTHAIFGVIRQQALGNIYYCLRTGVKVYLYDDSIVAKQLKRDGYIIFNIDTDLTERSLLEPLSEEQAFHNYTIWAHRFIGTSVSDVQQALFKAVNIDKS